LATDQVTLRLRFLLDTNILIPLQDSFIVLERNLANFVRLASVGGHQLLYHPASVNDIQRDRDATRRERTLQRLAQYIRLENPPSCPSNTTATSPNDACDNDILYALECEATHALVTEDRNLHSKARNRGLANRVYTIQTAEDWLRRLHETAGVRLPNIQDVPLHTLTPLLGHAFFDSLREGYPAFDTWFREKAREGRCAWVYRDDSDALSALCIYVVQENEKINDEGDALSGRALKLSTFKVGELVRGRKIGELFLKAAFWYATKNACGHVFVHGNAERHGYLIELLEEFGFRKRGIYRGDLVLVKEHPATPPQIELPPTEYVRLYYPHVRKDEAVAKYLVPIRPQYHEILFPDYSPPDRRQLQLFHSANNVGNAIKLAYLCHTPTKSIKPGDLLLFYRTSDERAVTTLGVVDQFEILTDAPRIASLVSRRTVYSQHEIDAMAMKQTKVILFRFIQHFPRPITYDKLRSQDIVTGPIQSLRRIDETRYERLVKISGM
jgi:GNAT superfamily N-acetyltransferase